MRAPLALGITLVVLGLASAVSVPQAAAAQTPCWRAAIGDWAVQGKLDGHYSAACLRKAMQNAPTDLKIYSTLEDDFQAALRVRTARHLAGAHAAVASLDEPGRSSPVSQLAMVLGGLAIFVVGGAAAVTVMRRRRETP